jgi:hypothetical protein
VWGYDAALGALLLEAIPSEGPLSELGVALEPDEAANLIGGLHRSGEPVVGNGVVSLAERVEFIFGHWIERSGFAAMLAASRAGQGAAAAEVSALLALAP